MNNQPKLSELTAALARAALASALIHLLTPPAAQAETVYRCGADRSQYSQHPCDGGQELEVSDRRTDDQVKQGHSAAQSQTKVARDIEHELKEIDRHPAGSGSLSPRPAASTEGNLRHAADKTSKTRKKPRHQKQAGSEFTAVDPASLQKKRGHKAD